MRMWRSPGKHHLPQYHNQVPVINTAILISYPYYYYYYHYSVSPPA